MKIYASLLLLTISILNQSVVASEIPIEQMEITLSAECEPLSTVADCVNVSSGHFFQSDTDFIGNTIDPLRLERFYDSGSISESFLGTGFGCQFGFFASEIQKSKNHSFAMISERDGFLLPYRGKENETSHQCKVDRRVLKKGYTNLSKTANSHANFVNWSAEFDSQKNQWNIKKGNGSKKLFGKTFKLERTPKHQVSVPTPNIFLLTEEVKPNGNKLKFNYTTIDGKPRISRIRTYNRTEKCILNEINFNYTPDLCVVTSSCRNKIEYKQTTKSIPIAQLEGDLLDRIFLTNVSSSQKGKQSVYYNSKYDHPSQLRISRPDVGYLEVKFKGSRVETLSKPDEKGKPSKIYHFVYEKDNTKVYDAENNLIQYNFDDNHRLLKMGYWDGNSIVREDSFKWSKIDHQEGWLESKTIHLGNKIYQLHLFKYDSKGNVIEKNLYGNITGKKGEFFENTSDTDCVAQIYKYSNNDLNLLLSQTYPSGLTTTYQYLPGTNLRTCEFEIFDNKIQKRIFIKYDDNGEVASITEDDGDSADKHNLSNVTYRKKTTIIAEKDSTKVSFGKPTEIIESFYDVKNSTTVIGKKIKLTYDNLGFEIQRLLYDSNDNYCFQTSKKYDSHGNLVWETDPLNQSIRYQYNDLNQKIEEEVIGSGKITRYFYDQRSRLFLIEHVYSTGNKLTNKYSYNNLDQLVSESDEFGNETKYVYDALGRTIKVIRPPIETSPGDISEPTVLKKYNALNQLVEEIDENNHLTKYTFNLFRKPTEIVYPDKTIERFTYYLAGWLKGYFKSDGTSIKYYYNPKGKLVKQEWIDENGLCVKKEKYEFKSDNLVKKIDAAGVTTNYEYNYAGRKILEKTDDKQIHYQYDDFGRNTKIYQIINDYETYCEAYEYDWLDRIISEKVINSAGETYKHQEYQYDLLGNRINKVIHFSKNDLANYKSTYDSHGNCIFRENPLGNKTHWAYDYHHLNSIGQFVLLTTRTDELGRTTKEEFNVNGKIAKREIFHNNTLVSRTSFFYDAKDRLTTQAEDVIIDGDFERNFTVKFENDFRGNCLSQTELPANKKIVFLYDSLGRLTQKINPNQTIINYTYDPLDRYQKVYSSDGLIDYTFHYDEHDNPILTEDHVNNLNLLRKYDNFNRLIEESTSSGKTMHYHYDNHDRLTKLTLPDASFICYFYDLFQLKKIERYDVLGKKIYVIECPDYDLAGNMLNCVNPVDRIEYQYDLMNRKINIQSPSWQSTQSDFDKEGKLLKLIQKDPTGQTTNNFLYDSLNHISFEKGIRENKFAYDSLGNCVLKNSKQQKINTLNQVIKDESSTYQYDKNGNLIAQTNPKTTYSYDALNRLISCENNEGKTTFIYDAFGKCLQIESYGTKKELIYQNDREIGCLVDGKLTEFRLMHPKESSEITFAIELNGTVLYPLQDHRFNICALQAKDSLQKWYRYTVFGDTESYGNTSIDCPWLFANRRSICGLTMFQHRFNNPKLRRWLTPDPIGYEDGLNLYSYVHNNPLYYQDPNGQFAFVIPIIWGAVSAGGAFSIALPSASCLAGAIAGATLGYVVYNIDSWYDNTLSTVETEAGVEETEEEAKPKYRDPDWKPPRTEPNTLEEKLAMGEAKASGGGKEREIMPGKINDPKYKHGWRKCQHVHRPIDGISPNITIHFWENLSTGATEGFKFK